MANAHSKKTVESSSEAHFELDHDTAAMALLALFSVPRQANSDACAVRTLVFRLLLNSESQK